MGYTQGTSQIANIIDNDGTLGETLTGLSGLTDYDVYVRATCSGNSAWTGPYTFTTGCAPYAPPYIEDFNGTFTPICWEQAGSGTPATGPSDIGTSSWLQDEYL